MVSIYDLWYFNKIMLKTNLSQPASPEVRRQRVDFDKAFFYIKLKSKKFFNSLLLNPD